MQQPIYQDQQSSQQGSGQQMLLCPVRLVYETQILVQPGEQIHPNQTIFINPQNTPPWIQNRPQNNVLYVQQMAPNNYMPHVQQQAAQNPMYIQQNFNNLQQIIPQQMISQTQHKEVRTANVQMANLIQRNTTQTLQPNTGSYNSNIPSETTIATPTSNFGILPPNYIQNQISQNQINFIPTNVNKQIIANVQTPPRAVTSNAMVFPRNIEIQQNVCRPLVQQTCQPESNLPSTSLAQSITMVPMQNVQSFQKPNTENTIDYNVTQIRPIQTMIANKPTLVQPAVNTVSSYTNERIIKKIAAVTPKGMSTINTFINTGPKNISTFTYRPIQPRPQQQRNFTPALISSNTYSRLKAPTLPQTITTNANTQTASTLINTEQSVFNRKRKSESPDEIQKKMAVNNVTQKNTPVVSTHKTSTVNSVGVNTLPMQKFHRVQTPITTENSQNTTQSRTNESINGNQERVENLMDTESTQISETERLLRNTVFTQARNRVLADKQETISSNTTKVDSNASDNLPALTPDDDKNKDTAKDEKLKEIPKTEPVVDKRRETKEESVRKEPNVVSKPTFKEINLLGNSKSNDKNGFVLTHVLDGYVIQESNVAFPIRRPLKDKTLPTTADLNSSKDNPRNNPPESSNKIFNLSFLHLDEADGENRLADNEENTTANESTTDKVNPFEKLDLETVKTWTMEQLTEHLLKYEWEETVSVLREHEIDGESLFLVSRNQLMNIGINEEHAGFICDFVKR